MEFIVILLSAFAGVALGLPFISDERLKKEERRKNFKKDVQAVILYDMMTGHKGDLSISDTIHSNFKPLSKEDDEFIAKYYRQEIQKTKKYKKKYALLQRRINKLQELRHTMKETVEQGQAEQKKIESEQQKELS